jgi:transcription antitermination factor NusB
VGKRRRSRELALQLLYQLDVHGGDDVALELEEFWARNAVDSDVRTFAETLVLGTKKHQTTIDELISRFTEHWSLDRMAVVDRNILRQSVFELLWSVDVPPRVAINEALEVAKKFSTQESSRFINGVLDRIHREVRPASS